MTELVEKLALEAERIEEDAEHTYKGHYNASARWARYHLFIGLPSAILAAIAGAAAFKNVPELTAGLALLSTALTTVLTFLKPSERSQMHKAVAGQYQALRNQTRLYREIELSNGCSLDDLKSRLLELANHRDELNQSSPAILRKDYEEAKRDIDEGRAQYRVDRAGS